MSAYLWTVVLLGVFFLIDFLFVALQRWTASKQEHMSAEEFRVWYQKNYLGVTTKADTPVNAGAVPGNSRKARLDRPKP